MRIRTLFFLIVIAMFLLISGCSKVEKVEKEDVPGKVEAKDKETEKESTDDLSDNEAASDQKLLHFLQR